MDEEGDGGSGDGGSSCDSDSLLADSVFSTAHSGWAPPANHDEEPTLRLDSVSHALSVLGGVVGAEDTRGEKAKEKEKEKAVEIVLGSPAAEQRALRAAQRAVVKDARQLYEAEKGARKAARAARRAARRERLRNAEERRRAEALVRMQEEAAAAEAARREAAGGYVGEALTWLASPIKRVDAHFRGESLRRAEKRLWELQGKTGDAVAEERAKLKSYIALARTG
jgi:hypothetical protein